MSERAVDRTDTGLQQEGNLRFPPDAQFPQQTQALQRCVFIDSATACEQKMADLRLRSSVASRSSRDTDEAKLALT